MEIAFGQILRKLRSEARVTQEELAEFSGCTKQYISDIERGRNPAPVNTSLLDKFSKCLKIDDKQWPNLMDYAAMARNDIALDVKIILLANPTEIERLRRDYAK